MLVTENLGAEARTRFVPTFSHCNASLPWSEIFVQKTTCCASRCAEVNNDEAVADKVGVSC